MTLTLRSRDALCILFQGDLCAPDLLLGEEAGERRARPGWLAGQAFDVLVANAKQPTRNRVGCVV